MKKILVAILFISFLLAYTPLKELGKLPLLITHYIEHKSQNEGMSFIAYLKMHYFNGDPQYADYDKDMQLPFKTLNFNFAFTVLNVFPQTNFIIKKQEFFIKKIKSFEYQASNLSPAHLNNIWQPPKFC
ncbi:MAG: hypothetical protein JST94_03005 [Bacteroidetes bacterium]|nr:hypothetical protein [Bacteroidota bacterium]MBS1590670.1 hypothetical protein [Bacteroidota bacterium]MBS1640795.1 hypothetical protein [Bacteroidota bacterium]MBS1643156.1 hypothetical protein [Bacteroidota bacterium]MBS1670409.1 hypothetical protein [Bacteroidota bacterium]